MQDDQELLEVDVKDNRIDTAVVGEDALNLFIIAPARFEWSRYSNPFKDAVDYAFAFEVDSEAANTKARQFSAANKKDYCVYKVTTVSRFTYRGNS